VRAGLHAASCLAKPLPGDTRRVGAYAPTRHRCRPGADDLVLQLDPEKARTYKPASLSRV